MAGRKRKQSAREPSGKVQRASAVTRAKSVTDVVTAQPHRNWLRKRGDAGQCLNQRAESALGRLFLAGMITEPQCWAGERLRNLLREFHVVLASPVTASAAAIMVSEGVENPEEADYLAAECPETEEERRERVLYQFDAAKRALGGVEAPRHVVSQIDALLMWDTCPDDLTHIRGGLSALAALWRMTEPPCDEGRREVKVAGERYGDAPHWPHDEKEVQIVYRS